MIAAESNRARGFSLIEVLVTVTITGVVVAAFSTLMGTLVKENRSMGDLLEAGDVERQFGMLMADDHLCGCQLTQAPAMHPDPHAPAGAANTPIVELQKVTTNCDDPDPRYVFAAVGQKMETISQAFQVQTIAVRDLVATGRRDPKTHALNEYAGSIYVDFDPAASVGRALKSIKVSKVFNTNPDGTRLTSCTSTNDFYQDPVGATNGPGAFNATTASCPPGYTVLSGGWRSLGPLPAGCDQHSPQTSPAIVESRPFVDTTSGNVGWRVIAGCMAARAVAVCQRGHN